MFVIEKPELDRLYVCQKVINGEADTTELTDMEMLFLHDLAMTATMNTLAETNAMVFSEVEDALLN